MAGVRKKPLSNGLYQGYFLTYQVGRNGKRIRKFFNGTAQRSITREMAEALEAEHDQIFMGYRDAPKSSDKPRDFMEVTKEFLAWGRMQGGRGGRPWAKQHATKRERLLTYWQKELGLSQMSDLRDCLPRVERVLRKLSQSGKAGKTLQNYADGLGAFCQWAIGRGYLAEDPLASLSAFDTTPVTQRRALTAEEVIRFLEAIEEKGTVHAKRRRLGYEVALATGLRAGELRALKVKHLDIKRGGLQLEATWTKNRKAGFQPLPSPLAGKLATASQFKEPEDALLFVAREASSALESDLERAGFKKWGPGGKVDFHALRVAYVSFVLESEGVSVKEAQALARHSTPSLTMNTYGRARFDRLAEIAENVGEAILKSNKPTAEVRTGTDDLPDSVGKSASGVYEQRKPISKSYSSNVVTQNNRGGSSPLLGTKMK